MSIKPFFYLFKHKQLRAAIAANALYKPFYKLGYLATLKNSGLMDLLSDGPIPFGELAAGYGSGARTEEAFEAWLHLGCRLGLLRRCGGGYALRGLARAIARPENDATLALAQEAASLHQRLITETPARLRSGQLWGIDNQDAALTTRSSRALEPFQLEAIDRFFPKSGPCRLLEIGCGSAAYIRHVAMRNPLLTATGLELQHDAAHVAQENIHRWSLQDRVVIETGDIRARPAIPDFDVVTLYNNIYYFPVEERIALLSRTRQFLGPGGRLLLTTCCQGGNPGMAVLNLWGASNEQGGRLPTVKEMIGHLHEAGYARVETARLIPGDGFHAFCARS